MVEFSKECEKSTSASTFISGALANGGVWAAYGFYFGEGVFPVGGGVPGAIFGGVFGEGVNLVSFGLDYASCSYNGKTIGSNIIDLFKSSKTEAESRGAVEQLPKVSLE